MKTIIKEYGVSVILAIVMIVSSVHIYQGFNIVSGNRGGILLLNNTLIRSQTLENKELFWESLQFNFQDIFSPAKILYFTNPYYKSKSITLGIYQDELSGYFELPDEDEFIAIEPENIYIPTTPVKETVEKQQEVDRSMLSDMEYLKQEMFFSAPDIAIQDDLLSMWDFEALASTPLVIDDTIPGPKVLIFHTHVKEDYKADETGEVIGVAEASAELKRILEEKYGLETLHITDDFYATPESTSVTGNYERMEVVIPQILEEYPSIQVVIDVHRDGLDNMHLVGDVDGKQTAKIMIANGLCMSRNAKGELVPMQYLQNPYIEENLAFSVQAQIIGMEYYPEMMRKIYLMPYRYSTHMTPYSMLLELGANTNTAEEALNAVEPVAHMIAKVFQKD